VVQNVGLRARGLPRSTRGRRLPTQGPSWGYFKVNSSETLSIFGDKCPQNGSKNEQRAPRTSMGCPHIGPFVVARQPDSPALQGKSALSIASMGSRSRSIPARSLANQGSDKGSIHKRPYVGASRPGSWSHLPVAGAISWAFIAKYWQRL